MTQVSLQVVYCFLASVLSRWVTVDASAGPWRGLPTGRAVNRNDADDSSFLRSVFFDGPVPHTARKDSWNSRGVGERKCMWRHRGSLDSVSKDRISQALVASRGGGAASSTGGGGGDLFPRHDPIDSVVRVVGTITQALISLGKTVLPPTIRLIGSVVGFYRALPQDAILAQVGLVYCFAGGYYPTLFSSLQAARHCGLDIMVAAIQDLTDEAVKVIDATADIPLDEWSRREVFLYQTNIVIKTVDPVKINQAAGALYTTWLGVSAVLEKEYARVISLSLTMSYYLERVAHWILEPPVKLLVPKDYHNWVPVVIGWGCKAAAMKIAWRIQRILTASTSAMFGGVLFARAILRMLHRRGFTLFGWIDETGRETPLDEIIGFAVAGIGFYTQMQAQFENNFSFVVPFPLSLVTWPFDWAEKWIQWTITREPR